ncbi:uncharacterized protein LOC129581979 [Paramacrobiotus metropolitanus]|uniref:uncharacterized protein LOC129581979 n=1 Tax=Paramacrobiotus metropolitanus TaxID=2943436 RepID=UPI002445842B|nr:uncharacterized protein LOC129581979 [Paramacrobiotus metropolitanus]
MFSFSLFSTFSMFVLATAQTTVNWNNPAQQTTTHDIAIPTPDPTWHPLYSRPTPAPGAFGPEVVPNQAVRGQNYTRIEGASGISYKLLNTAQNTWVQLMPIAAGKAYVPIHQAPEVFARTAIWLLLLWHPEYMPAYNVNDAEDVWTDRALDPVMFQLGQDMNWQITNLTVYEPQNKTANLERLLDNAAFAKYEESLRRGRMYHNMPYFMWMVDAELAALEYLMGDALTDEAYDAFELVFEFLNLKQFHYVDYYNNRCLRRSHRSAFYYAGQPFGHLRS